MTDIVPIKEAFRLGYEITSDSDCNAWYLRGNRRVGPYKRLEDAAYAAIDEYEVEEAFRRDDASEDH
jgi:hypothetical protein